jgi:hypothetical protein
MLRYVLALCLLCTGVMPAVNAPVAAADWVKYYCG